MSRKLALPVFLLAAVLCAVWSFIEAKQPPPASLGGTGSGMAGRHFCLFRLLSLDIFERTYKKFTIKLLTCISL